MILHYLKIAWRNLLKYKTQSVISVLGLAIGFTAFAFALSWIRYEQGYDKHIKYADRIYRVLVKDSTAIGGVSKYSPNALAKYLKETYPEIEAATTIDPFESDYNLNGKVINRCKFINADTSFFNVFYPDFKIDYPEVIDKTYHIITESTAKTLDINYQDIGSRVDAQNIQLLSIVPDQPLQSNIPFDIILINKHNPDYDDSWGFYATFCYILVNEGISIENLESKLSAFELKEYIDDNLTIIYNYQAKIVPLKELRITHPDNQISIKFNHIRIFSIISFLVIFCALFNYLMLFISRMKIRSRELSLQRANGASTSQLLLLLFCEFLLLLFMALLLGLVITEIIFPWFIKFSMIEATKSIFIYDVILFGLAILILSVITSYLPIRYFMKQTIRESLVKEKFTFISISLQLVIGVLLLFSTIIFLYQYNYLNSNYIGFNRHNINTMFTEPNDIPFNEVKKIEGVEDIIRYGGNFLPKSYTSSTSVEINDKKYTLHEFTIFGPEYIDFFEINLIEGRNIFEGENAYLINQTAQRLLSLQKDEFPVLNDVPVVGVVQDMYIDSPLLPVLPTVYRLSQPTKWGSGKRETKAYAYKYTDGYRISTEEEIKKLITEEVGNGSVRMSNMEALYAEYTKSERYLLILLIVMTSVAILIAIFGIYSMVTLACNRRRKEIAIRKVNGATVKEIFMLFFKQYFWITIASSAVAFPIGIYVMQRWLEQYTRRVSMEWWLFVGVLALVLVIVMASMVFRVIKAAKENPAEVVKSE